MSFIAILTDDAITETWTGATNKSDAHTTVEADGGSISRKLGVPTSQTSSTVTYTSGGVAEVIHMGTWVTDSGSPESITLPNTTAFGLNDIFGYVSGSFDSYVEIKISIVTEAATVLTFDRTLIDWTRIRHNDVDLPIGSAVGDSSPMGSAESGGITNFPQMAGADTLAIGERIAVEVAYDTVGSDTDTLNIEYGAQPNQWNDATLLANSVGTGKFGTSIISPITWLVANQGIWGVEHSINVPVVSGTDTIAWADVGEDWTAAKWETTGAQRYVMRHDGVVTAQFWIFQDDDYLYIAMNNIIDGCIQVSDHHEVFLCPTEDWQNTLEPDNLDWSFRRMITSGTSATRTPTLPVAPGDENDGGEYILQGDPAATYPENWEIPSYDTGVFTFSSNAKTWTEGTDFRLGGPGRTFEAPNPNGGNEQGSYSEFKISKANLNNWNGTDNMGILINMQCDIQADGHVFFPSQLGNQTDVSDWNWTGAYYPVGSSNSPSATSTLAELDLRPLMAASTIVSVVAKDVTFEGTRISTADTESDGGTWDKWGATQSPTQETDFVLQGAFAMSNKISNTTGGIDFDATTPVDMETIPATVVAKVLITTTKLIDITVPNGATYQVGSGPGDYYDYYIFGSAEDYPLDKSWLTLPIDPNVAVYRDNTVGGPVDLTVVDYYGWWVDITASAKAENIVHDALDYVPNGSGLILTGGGGANPDATFLDFVIEDEDIDTNRWRLAQRTDGSDQVLTAVAVWTIGSDVTTIFTDVSRTVKWPGGRVDTGFMGLKIDVQDVLTEIAFNSCTFISDGIKATNDSRADLIVTGSLGSFVGDGCGFNNFRSFVLTSSASFIGCALTQPEYVMQGGAIFENCTFNEPTVATGVAFMEVDNILRVVDSTFTSSGTGYAITGFPIAGDYSLTDLIFEDYALVDGVTGDEAIYVEATTGIVNLFISGGTLPSIRTAGATVNVIQSAVLTVGGVREFSDIWIYRADNKTLLASADPVTNTDGTPINGVQFYKLVYAYNAVDLDTVDVEIKVFNLAYINERIDYTLTSEDATVNVQQRIDRNYSNP